MDMASINGVSGNNLTSSLYNSANVISGLASGLDTEGMIEGLVQSYQTKIQNLTNKATKLEWKQEAYRNIINSMYAFTNKYTSFSSSTNLMSRSFFTNAIKIAAIGANADKVSATGRTDSDVKINSVKQLATAARYNTGSNLKGVDNQFAVAAEDAVKFDSDFYTGALSGSLTLTYGDKTVSVVFDPSKDIIEDKVFEMDGDEYKLDDKGNRIAVRNRTATEKAEDLQKLIEKKLGDTTITLTTGESRKASEMIEVKRNGTSISFKDKSSGGNNVYISGASGTVEKTLGLDLEDAEEKKPASFSLNENTRLSKSQKVGNYISGATMNVSLDGKTKSIKLPTLRSTYDGYEILGADGKYSKLTGKNYVDAVQAALDKEYGAGKLKVSNLSDKEGELQLSIKAPDNSDLIVNTDVGEALGIGTTATNYLSTSKTLGELLDKDVWDTLPIARGEGRITTKEDGKRYDSLGRQVDINNALIDSNGNKMHAFEINGVVVGAYSKDTKLSTLINDINNSKGANVKLSYSQTTRQFSFASKDTGSENEITINGGLAGAIFGNTVVDTKAIEKTSAKSILHTDSMAGKKLNLKVDGKEINYTIGGSGPSMKNILDAVNSQLKSAGIDGMASFSAKDGSLIVTNSNGKQLDVEIKEPANDDDITKKLFDGVAKQFAIKNYTKGKDALFTVEVNGQEMEMTRGSNSANIDGMTVNFKQTFNEDHKVGEKLETEAISFNQEVDSDKIVDAVKDMVKDYNEMMALIRDAYATLPYQDSSGAFKTYEPLSDEDKATMSESAIQAYEAKAKQGILFNDTNLSNLYQRMHNAFDFGGEDGMLLKQMGITWTYSTNGTSYIALDESKLRETVESDPDAVADLFSRSVDSGASSNGIMQAMKVQLDRYASTTGAVKGILVQQAGSPLSSLTLMNNEWQKQIDNIGNEITKWQDKLSAQVDKYTSMFSKLEVLINQMNSQSSTLAGMMGAG